MALDGGLAVARNRGFFDYFWIASLRAPSGEPLRQITPSTRVHPAPEAISASLTAASASQAAANPKLNAPADLNDDQQLLEEVSSSSPAVRASYENDLRHVNEYIRDAEQSAKAHPDDEEAQQYLMNAYEQKAMVYELAMDRSLP